MSLACGLVRLRATEDNMQQVVNPDDKATTYRFIEEAVTNLKNTDVKIFFYTTGQTDLELLAAVDILRQNTPVLRICGAAYDRTVNLLPHLADLNAGGRFSVNIERTYEDLSQSVRMCWCLSNRLHGARPDMIPGGDMGDRSMRNASGKRCGAHVKYPPEPPEVLIWASSDTAMRRDEIEGTALDAPGMRSLGTRTGLEEVLRLSADLGMKEEGMWGLNASEDAARSDMARQAPASIAIPALVSLLLPILKKITS